MLAWKNETVFCVFFCTPTVYAEDLCQLLDLVAVIYVCLQFMLDVRDVAVVTSEK